MGHVRLKPTMNLDIAIIFGQGITMPEAKRIQARAKARADMVAKHSSVSDRIDISVHAHGSHSAAVMSVIGRDGSQIASHLEFGYFNRWLENRYGIRSPLAWMPGLHIMSGAR